MASKHRCTYRRVPRGSRRWAVLFRSPGGGDWRFVVAKDEAGAVRKAKQCFGLVAKRITEVRDAGTEPW